MEQEDRGSGATPAAGDPDLSDLEPKRFEAVEHGRRLSRSGAYADGSSSSLPLVPRPSISSWAREASESG